MTRRLVVASLTTLGLASPAVGADVPDFSGQWGRAMLHYEQPASSPGPVLNTKLRANGSMDQEAWVGDHNHPILKPEAAAIIKKRGEIALSGRAAPDPHNQCWPEPTPFAMSTQFGMQLIRDGNKIAILYLANHQVRHVHLNESHPATVTSTWHGHSVARYEGDTLVIDTVGVKVGPEMLAIVDLYGMPYSESLHVIERYRLIDGAAARDAHAKHERAYRAEVLDAIPNGGRLSTDPADKGLQVELTIEDPQYYTGPWKALVTYRRLLDGWPESVCAENTREYYANKDTEVPVDDTPDF
jgi:hypothetical protein